MVMGRFTGLNWWRKLSPDFALVSTVRSEFVGST
jgi:hypothetical protein